ncbi:hypothetical protein DFR50_105193 [Roseiarcus fermentans]|uniref:Pycsar effector protein domain-containing protein n=1 Tax=Roseiarcus fermentans TaxID=1473586 RepID=A0A366FR73_9HYPH|nr:hypothetical protein [Roseiarcus fermentans]RBP16550.1 hypothetical protein DFR50_105193 [Roseiarcus fermentans]
MAGDRNAKLRNLLAGYSDSIRLSDAKANIGVLFVAIMMGTVVQYRDAYPSYLTLPILLLPFMFIFVNLLVSVYPRFPRTGRGRFPIQRRTNPEDFDFLMDPAMSEQSLPETCAMFSRILWWKNITLQLAYIASMGSIVAAGLLLFFAR